MTLPTVSCPQCLKTLKLAQPPREGKRVICPRCGNRFTPPLASEPAPVPTGAGEPIAAELLPNEPSRPATFSYKPLVLAAVGAFLFVALSMAAAIVLTQGPHGNAGAQNANAEPPPPTVKEAPPTEDAKAKERQQQEKRQAEFDKLMAQANQALAGQRYEEAAKAYTDALELFPQNLDAAKGASLARKEHAAQTKDKQEADRRTADFARLMDEGKKALEAKQYAQAKLAFENALALMPGQADAIKATDEAKLKLAADTEEKKKLADYEKFMAAGRAALVAERYADAIREYSAALGVLPNDAAALDGKRMAERRIGDEQNEEKRRSSYAQAMKIGEAALQARKYNDAVSAFELAAKLYPGDKDAAQGMKLAKDALTAAAATFNALMTQGQAAAALGRWEEAVRSYSEAARLFPDNPTANQALASAQKMMLDLQTLQAAYLRYMNAAAIAMQAGRYADAVGNYTEALRLVPTSPDAALGLRQAQVNLDREIRNRASYNQAMDRAANAYKQGRFADAVRHYQDALALYPDDMAATAGLHQARYAQYIAAGNADMQGKKYADAVRDYENALREMPGDLAAARALAQARALAAKGK